ncbi:lysophospholipid acyltransferase family protein [Marinicella pacifica]|nr:1-acyl-sn-glycerol-3-phosphate acyltransferase [Marinicella pacifica]
MKLPHRQVWPLALQKVIAFLCMPLLYFLVVLWMKYIKNYRIRDLQSIRQQFKQIRRQNPSGLLICPNHLTYIDSLLLAWAFSSMGSYLLHFRTFCWNLPNARNVQESLLYRVICYLGKCILIDEDPEKAKQTMNKAAYLLHHGHYVMIFPEGRRSQSGRVDNENYIYGVGKLHMDSHLNQVLCVYLRGDKQQTASKMPDNGERFNIKMKLQTIDSEHQGRRAMRAAAGQIINNLENMEKAHFEQFPLSKQTP